MFLSVAVGAQQNALIEFCFDLLEVRTFRMSKRKVLTVGIEMMKFQTADIAVVSTATAAASLVFYCSLFLPLLTLDSLAVCARLAVDTIAILATSAIKLTSWQTHCASGATAFCGI